jgi:hypothetical protein
MGKREERGRFICFSSFGFPGSGKTSAAARSEPGQPLAGATPIGQPPGGLAKPVEGGRTGAAAQAAGALFAHPDRPRGPPAMAELGERNDISELPLGRPTVAAGAQRHGREFGWRCRQIPHGLIGT